MRAVLMALFVIAAGCRSSESIPPGLLQKHIHLRPEESVIVRVWARAAANPTHVDVGRGERYEFTVLGFQQWYDRNHASGADGYRFGVSPRRVAAAPRFALVGSIAGQSFTIGSHVIVRMTASGEINCFANDTVYRNNSGSLDVTIRRLE